MADLALSFTATRDLDDVARGVIVNVLTALPFAASYITGGAKGGDAFIGRWLAENRPDAWHVVIVPANKSQVVPWWLLHRSGASVEVIPMPAGTDYEDRNAELVHRGTAVCGFPARIENDPRSRRSGSWQTVRMARRAGKLHRWDTVTWPFTGCVERSLRDIAATRGERD